MHIHAHDVVCVVAAALVKVGGGGDVGVVDVDT